VLHIFGHCWNGSGLFKYLEREGFRGRLLRWIVVSVHTLFHTTYSASSDLKPNEDFNMNFVVPSITNCAFTFLASLEPQQIDAFLEDTEVLALWTEIHKNYLAYERGLASRSAPYTQDGWEILCESWLKATKHSNLRIKLMQLKSENTQGAVV